MRYKGSAQRAHSSGFFESGVGNSQALKLLVGVSAGIFCLPSASVSLTVIGRWAKMKKKRSGKKLDINEYKRIKG